MKKLPSKDNFYSELTQSNITDEDYDKANLVWNNFNIKNLGEYHDLYLKTDVLLLTDVFENFREMCLNYYGLDPAYYLTLPNYAWDVMLYTTNVELEQIHDLDMYEMFEKGLRGGMCQVSHKHIKANNKYMDNYDETKPSSYINYLDANNLYGLAMTEKLPYSNFKWSDDIKITNDVLNYENNDDGYILEVDLEYPKHLHDLHSDYPLAPENIKVKAHMISSFTSNIYKKYNKTTVKDENVAKLILSLYNKEKYVVHIQNLKYYLEQGLILKKVHRCIKFNQYNWLSDYILMNNKKRKEATTDFEKDLYKLMNNARHGKPMENVRNHGDSELVDDINRLEKCLKSPTFKAHTHY